MTDLAIDQKKRADGTRPIGREPWILTQIVH
jgi:hypothetical protein